MFSDGRTDKSFGASASRSDRQTSVWKLMRKRLPSGIFINMEQGCDVNEFTESACMGKGVHRENVIKHN